MAFIDRFTRFAMGKSLLECSQLFCDVIKDCDDVLRSLPDAPNWRIQDLLAGSADPTLIDRPSASQIACTALQIGLVELWGSWGVIPEFVIGHSSGEIAACYAAGAYSLRDTIVIAFYRGKYVQEGQISQRPSGAMCAVGCDMTTCTMLLSKISCYATIAAINSPVSCTISGDHDALEAVIAECKERQIFCRKLKVDVGE